MNPWITHWALALVKRIREPRELKKKSFDLGWNRTHDLRIRSTVTLPTELRGRTEKVGDDLGSESRRSESKGTSSFVQNFFKNVKTFCVCSLSGRMPHYAQFYSCQPKGNCVWSASLLWMEAGARSFITGFHEGWYPKDKIAKLTQTLSVEETALTDLSVAKLSGVDNERTVPFCTERLLKERGIDSEELVCPDASSRHSLG